MTKSSAEADALAEFIARTTEVDTILLAKTGKRSIKRSIRTPSGPA